MKIDFDGEVLMVTAEMMALEAKVLHNSADLLPSFLDI